jgi:hypothetical protein
VASPSVTDPHGKRRHILDNILVHAYVSTTSSYDVSTTSSYEYPQLYMKIDYICGRFDSAIV